MCWEITFVIISFIIYLIYNIVIIILFGIPNSLSRTYYLFQGIKKWQRILFPLVIYLMMIFLMPSWLDISSGNNLQFMVFFATGGILLTGSAPAFEENEFVDNVHTYSAIFSAVFSLLWIIFATHLWYTIILWLIIILIISIITKTLKTSYIYWLETVTFMSTYTTIIQYYINI